MDGKMFVFTRRVATNSGEVYNQIVTVFARDRRRAERILNQDLDQIRELSASFRVPYKRSPAWYVDEVPLDCERVVSSAVLRA